MPQLSKEVWPMVWLTAACLGQCVKNLPTWICSAQQTVHEPMDQSTDPARCKTPPALAATAIRWGCRGWHAIWYTLGTFFCPLGNRDSNEMSCSTLPLLGYLCKTPHCLFVTVATDGLRCTDLPLPSHSAYTAVDTC